jgi:hypothetical protein
VKQDLKPYVKDSHARVLLDKLLVMDPSKRYDAGSTLKGDWEQGAKENIWIEEGWNDGRMEETA